MKKLRRDENNSKKLKVKESKKFEQKQKISNKNTNK